MHLLTKKLNKKMKPVLTFKNCNFYDQVCEQLKIKRTDLNDVDFSITRIGNKYNVEPIQIDIIDQPTWYHKSGAQRILFHEVVYNCLKRIENTYHNQTASPGIVAWDGE